MKIRYASVSAIQEMPSAGPWNTKSGGNLTVLMKMPWELLQNRYLAYDEEHINEVPQDIRGLRIYAVRDLPKGSVGGMEWHRIREEMVFVLEGSVCWRCEDVSGKTREFILDNNTGIWMPPGILHTYEVLVENTELLVLANTLFMPDDPATHDTYSLSQFRDLQNHQA